MTPARPVVVLRLLLGLCFGLAAGLGTATPGYAYQTDNAAFAAVTDINASDFPNMAVQLVVHGSDGLQVQDLPATAFALAENGVPVPALSVSTVEVGVQVAFLVVPDELFTRRDGTGTSRYEYIQQSINEFLVDQPWMKNGLDDVSLLTPAGPLQLHSNVGAEVSLALQDYQPVIPQTEVPLLGQITSAVELAQPVGPGQGKAAAVVVYAAGLSNTTPDEIDLAASQARAQGVPIYAINISPPLDPESVSATNLRRLAEGSGGQMVYFEKVDAVTPIFELVAGQRMQYVLSYRSHLATSGLPAITVLVRLPGVEPVTSDPATFSLSVQPPEVAVSGLAADVRRQLPTTGTAANAPAQTQEVRVAVAFPDGHQRDVAGLKLLVDGTSVAEVTEPPFNKIVWDVTAGEVPPGVHEVQVQLIDELGMVGVSPPFEVTITDLEPVAVPATVEAPTGFQVPWVGIGLAVGLLALVVVGGLTVLRLRPRLFAGLGALADRDELARQQAARNRMRPPPAPPRVPAPAVAPPITETQPIAAPMPPVAAKNGVSHPEPEPIVVKEPAAQTAPAAAATDTGSTQPMAPPLPARRAFFEILQVGEGSRTPIDLSARPVTLGRDPAVATVTFVDRSVSRLHARVAVDEKGAFRIYDEGSTSGTWVNYEPVNATGRELQHGDLVNLGRIQLRFRLRPVDGTARGTGPLANSLEQPQDATDDTTIPFKPKRRRWGGLR